MIKNGKAVKRKSGAAVMLAVVIVFGAILMSFGGLLFMNDKSARADISGLLGTGYAHDPYRISSAAELAWFRDHVNDDGYDYENQYLRLEANINLTDLLAGFTDG